MFEAARRHLRSVAMIGVASALTVGGVAVAQGGGGGDVQPAKRPVQGASAVGSGMSSLTYAELRARGDVVRAIRGSHLPAPPGAPLRFEMVAPPAGK